MTSIAENYGQTFIRNEIEKQYQEALQELNYAIYRVKQDIYINSDNIKRKKIFNLFFNFMKQNFPKNIKLTELINKTYDIIKTHPGSAFEIITSFTQDRIAKGKSLEEIGNYISQIIQNNERKSNARKNNPNLVPNIVTGFIKGCLMLKPDNREDIERGFNNLLKGTGYEGKYDLEEIINSFYNQYKRNLNILKTVIENITKEKTSDHEKEKIINNEFLNFILYNVQEEKTPQLLIETTSEIIKNNPRFAFAIIDAFTASFICKGKKMEYIGAAISQIIQNNERVVFDIIDGFVNGFFKMSNDIGSLVNEISKITENNPKFAFEIITSFTQYRIAKGESLEKIGNSISQIIKNKGINNQELVNKIICGFVKGCLMRKPDNREDIKKGFHNLLKETGYEKGYNLQEIIDSFYNQYKRNLNILKTVIEKITKEEKSDSEKEKIIGNEFFNFILYNVQEEKNPQLLIKTASEIIKNNPRFAFIIINAFTAGFICKGKNLEEIGDYISQIIKNNEQIIQNNERVVFDIIDGFAHGFFKMSNDIGSLVNEISKITENNPEFASVIINVLTQELVCKRKKLEYIGAAISQIIKNKGINNQELVNNIICGFVQGYLQRKGDDINNLTNEISKIINKNKGLASGISAGFTQGCFLHNQEWEDIYSRIYQIINTSEIKNNQKLISNIVNAFNQIQHRIITFINSSNRQLSRKDKQYKEGTDYRSLQPYDPSANPIYYSSTNGEWSKMKSLIKVAELEQKKYSSDRKRERDYTPDSEGKNNSSPSKRLKQQNQQGDRSR